MLIMKHYIILLLLSSCATPKFNFVSDMSDIESSAIHNAIELFTKTKPKIYNKDSVFHITYTDSVYRLAFRALQPNKERVWVLGTYYEELSAVSISGNSHFQYFLTPDIKVGSKGKRIPIPTRFIVIDGKLFHWYDDNYPITEELLTVFHKYNLFLEDTGAIFPDNPVDDSKKGISYFFCKKNLAIYKKVISSSALGYFDIPKIKCK